MRKGARRDLDLRSRSYLLIFRVADQKSLLEQRPRQRLKRNLWPEKRTSSSGDRTEAEDTIGNGERRRNTGLGEAIVPV